MCAAVEVAQKSVDLDGRIWQNHYWYALAIGSQIRHQSVQKKIVGGFEYKVRATEVIHMYMTD